MEKGSSQEERGERREENWGSDDEVGVEVSCEISAPLGTCIPPIVTEI